MKHFNLFVVIAPVLAVILVAVRVYYALYSWRYDGPDTFFHIKPEEKFSSINYRLSESKLISSARLFHRYAQFKKSLNKFKSGTFKIKSGSNLIDIYNTLMNERGISEYFTIPEGKNMYEIGKMLEEKGFTTYREFVELCKDPGFIKELGLEVKTLEGRLYPDTYDFSYRPKAKELIKALVSQFNKKISSIDFTKSRLSKEEIITLASIVEKETGDKSERPVIAGVFLNRLNKNMRLQSDPTTIYGMFENYNGNITKKDLLTPTEYNTYTKNGLPIGPISNPGIESINAVLAPVHHRFLYFVSKNEGTHAFSETYEEHQAAVITWQKTQKNRNGKSWRNKNSNSQVNSEATRE